MFDIAGPLLIEFNPKCLLCHVETNDSTHRSPDDMVNDTIRLKQFCMDTIPDLQVVISLPIMRTDNGRANNTIYEFCSKMSQLNIHLLHHENITENHLGRKGLHLSKRGIGRLALNIMSLIRQL